MSNWIQLDANTWTQADSEFVYHVSEDAVGLLNGDGSFDIFASNAFLEAARTHVKQVAKKWQRKTTEVIVLNPEVRMLLTKATSEVRTAFLIGHGNYDDDRDPLHNPDWCKMAEACEMKRYRSIEARVRETSHITVIES